MLTLSRSKVNMSTLGTPVITRNNVLKHIPCTEGRLFQIFLGHVKKSDDKLRDRLSMRLIRTLETLRRRRLIVRETKLATDGGTITKYTIC